ncbi:tetratricopeptide repeat protein [Lacibacter sp.]|uniref:tetratricopeptide repeat protein n=1 Tax=Lacibacter sp. TaxID=1915409 RepID=UPI002B4AC842|nr:tetratricopeptide repeat protein [Lacibacter sp.]HLP35883.1 tetratricopeptide repeat protein [Lacibacter sp.]
MSETKKTTAQELNEVQAIKQAKDFWGRFSKPITYIGGLVILLAGGYLVYKNFFIGPKETKANEAISRAQQYFAQDSLDLALNGDGSAAGFLKIIKTYSGTKAANLAHYYAGAIYLRKEDYNNAIKQLEDFSTDATQVQSAAWRMLGDAYMSTDKKEKGASYYEKAGTLNDKDEYTSSDNLYRAAMAYEVAGKKEKATELLKALKEKYPKSTAAAQAEKYLARLGVVGNE